MPDNADRVTRFAADLLDSAAAGGSPEPVGKQQLDHWAEVGRAVSSQHSAARRRVEPRWPVSWTSVRSAPKRGGVQRRDRRGDPAVLEHRRLRCHAGPSRHHHGRVERCGPDRRTST